jgi:predicted TIM-barrel fold metal-dependent hydrolase
MSAGLIDADVHAAIPSVEAILPYMEPEWADWLVRQRWTGPTGTATTYPPGAPSSARPEWRPDDGAVPASSVELVRHQLLDPRGVEIAILNCCSGVESIRNPHVAIAFARAVNDWLVGEWLEVDPRLRASIVVPARDPVAAAAEVDRIGDHPGFVQVALPVRCDRLYGERVWHPLLEAIVRRDLVMGIAFGGTPEGGAASSTGVASYWVEQYAAEWQNYLAHIVSMVAQGTFRDFPALRVALLECGFTWLPFWGWRMDKDWKGTRSEVPWVTEPPFETLRAHFRVATAPVDAGPVAQLARIIEWIDCAELLMFSSDYPHANDDDEATLLEATPAAMRDGVLGENARAWYRL